MKNSYKFILGKIGEYIACADLLEQGYTACLITNEDSMYDIIVDYKGKIIKIQVKATNKKPIKESQYYFRLRKTNHSHYSAKEIDIFALVILNKKKVLYVANENLPTNVTVSKYKILRTK